MKKFSKKISKFWGEYIAPLMVLGLVALTIALLLSMPFLAADNSTSTSAYEADCAKLGELRQELSELKNSGGYWQNSSRIEELREEIRTIERRCKGY